MDLLSMLKLSNIFSPNGQMAQQNFPIGSIGGETSPISDQSDQQAPQAPIIPGMDDNTNLMQMLNPKDEQFNNLAQLIQQVPQRADFHPSLLRRISGYAANLGSGGPVGIANGQAIGYKSDIPSGLKAQSAITDEPFNKAYADWANKEGPTLEAAKLENTRNVNSRIAGSNIRTQELRNREQQRKDNWDLVRQQDLEAKQENAAERTNISRQRQAAYTYDKEHPNHKYQEDSEGNVYSVDPKTDETQYLFDPDGNKIKSKNLSDEMKLKLQNQNALQQIGARAKNAQELEGTRQANRKELEGVRQLDRLGLKETPAPAKPVSSASAKPMLPTQVSKDRVNKALQAISANPELKGYIKFEKNNAGTVIGVSVPPVNDKYFAGLRGYNEKDRMRAYNAIFGEAPVPGIKQEVAPQRKEIPGHPGKFAVSTDGGKTWKAE